MEENIIEIVNSINTWLFGVTGFLSVLSTILGVLFKKERNGKSELAQILDKSDSPNLDLIKLAEREGLKIAEKEILKLLSKDEK